MTTIEKLENLDGILADDKASILFVAANLKPTAMVVMQGNIFPTGSDAVHIDGGQINHMHDILHELHLEHVMYSEIMAARSTSDTIEASQEVLRIYIAHSKETAQQLQNLFENVQKNHTAIGQLLGYPETAIAAFLTNDMLDWNDMPESTSAVNAENMKLLGHRLSKTHWQDEIQYLATWGTYLKNESPKIYNEIIND